MYSVHNVYTCTCTCTCVTCLHTCIHVHIYVYMFTYNVIQQSADDSHSLAHYQEHEEVAVMVDQCCCHVLCPFLLRRSIHEIGREETMVMVLLCELVGLVLQLWGGREEGREGGREGGKGGWREEGKGG